MPVGTSGIAGGPASNIGVGQSGATRIGGLQDTIVSELHGKYYEQNYRGNLFIATTAAAGAAIPAFSTAAQQFLVYNPVGSGVNCVPIKFIIGYVSTTAAAGHFCLGHSLTVQAAPGTTTPATTFPGKLGAPASAGKVQVFAPGTPASVLTYHSALPISQDALTAASTNAPWKFDVDCDGMYICPPGGIFSVAGNIALLVVATVVMIYEEVPI